MAKSFAPGGRVWAVRFGGCGGFDQSAADPGGAGADVPGATIGTVIDRKLDALIPRLFSWNGVKLTHEIDAIRVSARRN
jgi:hypothetical protein